MRYEIAKLHQSLKATMTYVTHDQVEAMTLADRIVVLDGGKIAQSGSPRELYEKPANKFVAQFIGSPKMNVLECETRGNRYSIKGGRGGPFAGDRSACEIGIRPEHIAFSAPGEGQIDGSVDVLEYLGADTFVIIDCGQSGKVTVRVGGSSSLKPGEKVGMRFQESKAVFLDSSSLTV